MADSPLCCAVYAPLQPGAVVVLWGTAREVLGPSYTGSPAGGVWSGESCATDVLSPACVEALRDAALVLGCGPRWPAVHAALVAPLCGHAQTLGGDGRTPATLTCLIERGCAEARLGLVAATPGGHSSAAAPGLPGTASLVFEPPRRGATAAFFAAVQERRDPRAWPLAQHLAGHTGPRLPPEHAEAYIVLRHACEMALR